jgi:hypothetical protein
MRSPDADSQVRCRPAIMQDVAEGLGRIGERGFRFSGPYTPAGRPVVRGAARRYRGEKAGDGRRASAGVYSVRSLPRRPGLV